MTSTSTTIPLLTNVGRFTIYTKPPSMWEFDLIFGVEEGRQGGGEINSVLWSWMTRPRRRARARWRRLLTDFRDSRFEDVENPMRIFRTFLYEYQRRVAVVMPSTSAMTLCNSCAVALIAWTHLERNTGAWTTAYTGIVPESDLYALLRKITAGVLWLRRFLDNRQDPDWFAEMENKLARELAVEIDEAKKTCWDMRVYSSSSDEQAELKRKDDDSYTKLKMKWDRYRLDKFGVSDDSAVNNARRVELLANHVHLLRALDEACQRTNEEMKELVGNMDRLRLEVRDVLSSSSAVVDSAAPLSPSSPPPDLAAIRADLASSLAKCEKWIMEWHVAMKAIEEHRDPATTTTPPPSYRLESPAWRQLGLQSLGPFRLTSIAKGYLDKFRFPPTPGVDGRFSFSVDNLDKNVLTGLTDANGNQLNPIDIGCTERVNVTIFQRVVRRRMHIPREAVKFCWCYPLINFKANKDANVTVSNSESESDDDAAEQERSVLRTFFLYGGFAYFNANGKPVGVNALSDPGANMFFGSPRQLTPQHLALWRESQGGREPFWHEITIPELRDVKKYPHGSHAEKFAWVNPGVFGANGGFAYKTNDEKYRRFFLVVGDEW